MNKWIAEFELEDGDTMPEHMDLEYKGAKIDFHCRPMWIPCSERLPEGITQVIIQTNGEAIHEAIYMGKDDYGHYVWKRPDNEIYWDEEVVAWMPLPTPYQPKEDICK